MVSFSEGIHQPHGNIHGNKVAFLWFSNGFGAGPFSNPMHTRILRSSNCLLDGYYCKHLNRECQNTNQSTTHPTWASQCAELVFKLLDLKIKIAQKVSISIYFPHQTSPDSFGEHGVPRFSSEESPSPQSPIESPSPSEVRELEELVEELTETLRFHQISMFFFWGGTPKKWGAVGSYGNYEMSFVITKNDKWLFWDFFGREGRGQYQLLGAMGQTE